MAKFDSILGTVGNTPVVKINKLASNGAKLYVKIDAFNEGELQTLLGQNGVGYNQSVSVDPYSPLPTWLHPR